MKIFFICQSTSYHKNRLFGQGGTDSQIYGLASALSSKGHEVSVVGKFIKPHWKDPSVDERRLNFININALSFPDTWMGNLFSGLWLSKKIASFLKNNKPDLLILSSPFMGYFLTKSGIPSIYVTHNPTGMDFFKHFSLENHPLNYIAFPIIQRLEESILQRTDAIVGLNQYICNYLQGKGFTNIYNIPNAVNPQDYFSGTDRNYILYAGGFRRVKGIEFLLLAFSRIIDSHDTDLLLIGSGKDEKRLKKIVMSLKLEERVHFIPLVDKVTLRRYLSECSIFILPSNFEMMPVTLLEAMASSRTVIASNIPGPQDIITHKYDGFLFEKGNVNQLAEHLDLCLLDAKLRKMIGNNARETVEKSFSFDSIAKQYQVIIEEIC